MVVFVDHDDGDDDGLQNLRADKKHVFDTTQLQQLRQLRLHSRFRSPGMTSHDEGYSLNIYGNGFSAALSCYPVAVSISKHLDLNDLHALSRTCRQFYANLFQFHHQLIKQSLRCSFDSQPLLADILATHKTISYAGRDIDPTNMPASVLAAISSAQRSAFTDHLIGAHSKLLKSSKIGNCARDLVAECRKCSKTVCRNCAAKPPSDRYLKDRLRRLCGACLKAPLQAHTNPARPQHSTEVTETLLTSVTSSASSTRSLRSSSSSSSSSSSTFENGIEHASDSQLPSAAPASFTNPAFQRSPCCCATRGVFLCQACGQNLRAADTTYKRVWTWRSRYSTHIGGLGTGMGAGDQGQKCARGEECLDRMGAGLCWVEIDCCEQQAPHQQHYARSSPSNREASDGTGEKNNVEDSHNSTDMMSADELSPIPSNKPGYLRQEIKGVGGMIKEKVKKKVRTGATVWEFDDERESGKYLEREASGVQRSWCGWCNRVVMGECDQKECGEV